MNAAPTFPVEVVLQRRQRCGRLRPRAAQAQRPVAVRQVRGQLAVLPAAENDLERGGAAFGTLVRFIS